MIPKPIYKKLRENWGARADSLSCYAEIKFVDRLTNWAWYILAVNPDDDSTIRCIVDEAGEVKVCTWTLDDLDQFYNREGESPVIDREFRPMKADILYKKLKGNS